MRRVPSSVVLTLGGLLAFMAAPVLAADPSPSAVPFPSGTPAAPLEGTTWALTDLRLSGAFAPIPDGANTTMTLANGRASGYGGCNDWSAPYTLDGSKITFGDVHATLRLCEGAGGMVETFFFADLSAVATWGIDGSTLVLFADDGQPVVAFQALPTPSPEGSWLVTGYADATGALVPVDDGSVTVVFDAASVSGTAGCNGFNGPWTLTGDTLAIGPLVSTKKACEPASIMAREAAVTTDLEASTGMQAGADGTLTLLDASGAVRLTLSPPAAGTPGTSPAA